MFAARSHEDEMAPIVNNLLSSEKPELRRRLILALSGLSNDQWDYLESFLQGILDSKSAEETPEERHERHKREARAEAEEYYQEVLAEKTAEESSPASAGQGEAKAV